MALFSGCEDGITEVGRVEVSVPTEALVVGDEVQAEARVVGAGGGMVADAGVSWESDRPEVASVTGTGLIRGVSPGQARITASASGSHASVTVRVEPAPEPPQISTTSLLGAVAGEVYEAVVAATGGTGPYNWTVGAGSLPAGLNLTGGTGTIWGIPLSPGVGEFTIRVIGADGLWSERALVLVVSELPMIVTDSLPEGVVGQGYTGVLEATGGSPPYDWSVASGSLPAGLTLEAATGQLGGVPESLGETTLGFRVTASDGLFAERSLAIRVVSEPPVVVTSSLPEGQVGESYDRVLEASGGQAPYSWDVSSGTLPSGLELDPGTGRIHGTPTEGGDWAFAVEVRETGGQRAERGLNLRIRQAEPPPEPPTIETSELPAGVVDEGYTATLEASGGEPPYLWSVVMGTLPPGLSLDEASGVISGLPTTTGTWVLSMRVTGANGLSGAQVLTIVVEDGGPPPEPPTITTASLPAGVVGTPYSAGVEATGGAPPYAWTVAADALPPGLSLEATSGVISGIPSQAGEWTPTIRVTGADGLHSARTLKLTLDPASAAPTITTMTLPDGVTGEPYSATLEATGGTPPYAWSLMTGALPTGLALEASSGALSGTPTAAGSHSFAVRVAGANGLARVRTLTIEVAYPQRFFLAENGVTVRCPDAAIGETGEVGGVVYTRRTREQITPGNASTTCTTGITNMSGLFNSQPIGGVDLSAWDVSQVTNMIDMFSNLTEYAHGLEYWDVSNVLNMGSMFFTAPVPPGINEWDVSSVVNMHQTFGGDRAFYADISGWDVSNVESMRRTFLDRRSFNGDISGWNVGRVTDMFGMFEGAGGFNQDLSGWNVSSVADMGFLFRDATTFNGDITSWDVSNAANMFGMFWRAWAFDQDISGWDVSSSDNMNNMFEQARAFNVDLSGWCVQNIPSLPLGFDVDADAWTLPRPVWGTCPSSNPQ